MSKFTDLAELLEKAAQALREADVSLQSVPAGNVPLRMTSDQRKTILDCLTYREREIAKLRFGLTATGDSVPERFSLDECARIFKVTRARIRQLEDKVKAKAPELWAERLGG